MLSSVEQVQQLKTGIAALEAQRAQLGDDVVEAMLAPVREKLAALEASSRDDQQRKQATILFADVSGFTTLSETMDAEHVADIMNDLWALVDAAIVAHGGHIDKHIGDAVMALWGAEAAREDDPERAVHAALAVQSAVDAFCTSHHLPLALRVGLSTGPVLLGAVGTAGEITAIGDAVNLAARLEKAAPVGGVLISHDTYRHVRGVFDVQEQARSLVKGKVEPVRSYVVRRTKPRAFRMATRGVEGVETRMVGREAEMLALQTAYFDALESSETRVVTVVGEAGVGKSRLLYEFDNWLELRPETVYYFKGRGTPNTQSVTHSLFRDLFAYRFEILDSDSAAVALDKFRTGMAGALEPERADVVGHWLGFDFSSSEAVKPLLGGGDLGPHGRAYLVRYFRTLAGMGPVVILLEDLHWADESSLDLALHLVQALPDQPLLVIGAARPIFLERRPGWGEGEAAFRRVNLTPLSKRASRALVDEVLQRVDEVPDSLRELIIDAAEGNPFYVEEMVKMLIEQGVIERGISNDESVIRSEEEAPSVIRSAPAGGERWTMRADKLATLKVPATLTALLQARLDGLPRSEREVLQRASVVGRLFWDDAVADLMQVEREAIAPALQSVRRRELIFQRERSSFVLSEEYIFKHALLRDVTYETVLLKHRAEFHLRAARWLEEHAGDRIGEYISLIAEHYVEGGERLRAAVLLERLGHEAYEAGFYSTSRQALERALALREAAGETIGPAVTRAMVDLGWACYQASDYPAAKEALDRGLDGALAVGDTGTVAETRSLLAIIAAERGDYDQAKALLAAALPATRAAGGRVLGIFIRACGKQAWMEGDLVSAEAYALEALKLVRAMGDLRREIPTLNLLASIADSQRELDKAERLLQESLALARRLNLRNYEAYSLVQLGVLAYRRGDYITAAAHSRAALATETDLNNDSAYGLSRLALATLMLGESRAAREGAVEALALAHKSGDLVAWMVFVIGQLLIVEGDQTRGLALSGLARAASAQDPLVLFEMNDLLSLLNLPSDELEAGMAAGEALDLETVVQEILDGKW